MPTPKKFVSKSKGNDEGLIFKVLSSSHASLALLNSRQKADESLTAFIYRWVEFVTQCCSITAKECRDKLKLIYFLHNFGMSSLHCERRRKRTKNYGHTFDRQCVSYSRN